MQRDGHETAKMFIGTEVEHSPAYGMRTLFVVGVQDVDAIQAVIDENASLYNETKHIKHIYFGANQSFPNPAVNNSETWTRWENMIGSCLMRGYWCTLDLDVSAVEGLAESSLSEHDRFIPMISVKLPYIKLLNYNATLKLDDKDFALTNPGVWCHSVHELQNRSVFTDWSKYSQDKVIS
jgi:hypothetical protein